MMDQPQFVYVVDGKEIPVSRHQLALLQSLDEERAEVLAGGATGLCMISLRSATDPVGFFSLYSDPDFDYLYEALEKMRTVVMNTAMKTQGNVPFNNRSFVRH
jgi:hypothetical protein